MDLHQMTNGDAAVVTGEAVHDGSHHFRTASVVAAFVTHGEMPGKVEATLPPLTEGSVARLGPPLRLQHLPNLRRPFEGRVIRCASLGQKYRAPALHDETPSPITFADGAFAWQPRLIP